MRQLVHDTFLNPRSRYYFLVSDILAFFTILSVLSLVLETVPSLAPYATTFRWVEWAAVGVFTIEYVARLWVTKPKQTYIFSFFGIIDLISVLPTILGLGNLTFLKSARAVRILRLLRMVRMAKIGRARGGDIEASFGVVSLNIAIYITLLLVALLVFGSVLYVVETAVAAFVSIPAAMWWTLKVFLGSIPVEAPLSALGAVLYVLARFTGLILLGVLIGVVGNIIRHYLLGVKSK